MNPLPFLLFFFLLLATPRLHAASYDDMISAVKLGDTGTVVRLLNRGMDVNTSDREGNTLIMLAVREKHPGLVRLFIQQRAKVNARNMHGDSALRLAAYQGDLPVVQDLVAAGARIDTEGWTPLIYAAFNGHEAVAAFLLEKGADIDAKSENGMTALMAAARGGFLPLVKRFVAAGAAMNEQSANGETALDWAVKTNNSDVAEYLRAQGARPGEKKPPQ
jgi:ankyrin repeat protein